MNVSLILNFCFEIRNAMKSLQAGFWSYLKNENCNLV